QKAREALERALTDAPESVAALEALLPLVRGAEPARFIEVFERLDALGARALLDENREALAEAYETLGRRAQALEVLELLPEPPERLEKRAALCDALGRAGDALELRERAAQDDDGLERVLLGYFEAQLVAPAA